MGFIAPPPTNRVGIHYLDAAVLQFGSSSIDWFYHTSRRLSVSGSNFTSIADVRGASGFGPTLVANGGLGGTPPTVDGNGMIVTDGAASFIANASADAKCSWNTNARTVIVWGEFVGTPGAWWGIANSLTSPTQQCAFGMSSGKGRLYCDDSVANTSISVAKTNPPEGRLSAQLFSNQAPYDWTNADQVNDITMRAEWIGHGPTNTVAASNNDSRVFKTDPSPTVTNGFIAFGRIGSTYGAMKLRGAIRLNRALTIADRVILERLLAYDGVQLYDRADSQGMVLLTGDSVTASAFATTMGFGTPPDPAATTVAAQLQAIYDAAGKKVQVVPWGLGGQNLNVMRAVWTGDAYAYCSPARRAAGLKEYVYLGWGTNDIGNQGLSAATMYANTTAEVTKLHAAGIKCMVPTIIPRGNFTAPQEAVRLAYNALVESNGANADYLCIYRFYNAGGGIFPYADNAYPSNFNLTFYRSASDLTHQKDAGDLALASHQAASAIAQGAL